ncbi:hypothetical protein COV16_03600 [Candidatus Woesearchaeota archaeon CG10_big_fil_rev_8_21_14_0_10_34_8]|nr:MAG: hypothetical protein COV16_03600 [Candidatus Woesearchaeota archaeon CG10_big_fil_rev_8_21_14_0_10_34_8]
MKRGQIEIMGLMIIVVILALLLLFVVKVVFTAKQTDYTQNYETNKLVESFVNTLFQTTSGCTGDVTIQELLIDCARQPYSGGSITCNDGRMACNYANETIAVILEDTIDTWGYESAGYEFIAVAPPNVEVVYYSSGNLSSSLSGEVEPFTLRLYPSTQDLYVYLCIGGCGFR